MEKAEKTRYHMLDTLRGVMIIGVVLSHFLIDMAELGSPWAQGALQNPFVDGISAVGRMLFILLAGICTHLSRNNLKRGLLVLGAAAFVSIATLIGDLVFFGEIGNMFIYMGILHLLAFCMLLYAGLELLLKKMPPLSDALTWVFTVVFIILFALTYNLCSGVFGIASFSLRFTPHETFLSALLGTGIYRPLVSADSFPAIPWSFIFFAGAFLGKYFKEDRVPAFLRKDVCPPVTYIGKKTLWIYLLHQPLVYGIAVLICNVP